MTGIAGAINTAANVVGSLNNSSGGDPTQRAIAAMYDMMHKNAELQEARSTTTMAMTADTTVGESTDSFSRNAKQTTDTVSSIGKQQSRQVQ